MSALSELIDKYGIDAVKEAMGKSAAEGAEKEAFNSPSLKVGDTPVSPEDFSQVAQAQSVPPAPLSQLNQPPNALTPRPQNMTPVKEDLPAFGSHLDPLASEQTPTNDPSTLDSIMQTAGENKAPIAAGAAAMAGGAAAMQGSPQAQQAAPPSIADLRKSDDSVPAPKPPAQNNEDEDDSDQDDSISKTPRAVQTSRAPSPGEISKTQDLANFMSAQDKGGETYADASKRQNLATLGSQLAEAGNIIGGSIAMVGPNAAASNANRQNTALAQGITKDFQAKQAAESEDPNSAMSKNYRDFLSKYGVKVGPGVTAQQIKDTLLPSAQKEQDLKEKAQAMKDSKQLSMEQIKAYKELQQSNKDRSFDEGRRVKDEAEFDKVGKEASVLRQSQRTGIGQATAAKVQAQRLIELLSDPRATNQDLNTAAALMNRIESGTSTIGGAKEQQYSTLKGTLAAGMQYINSNPTAPDVPQQKQHMIEVANRMSKISDRVIDFHLGGIKHNHPDLYKRRPEDFNNIINYALQQTNDGQEAPRQGAAQAPANAPHAGKYPPGSTVMIKGKPYTVAPNGDDLQEQ